MGLSRTQVLPGPLVREGFKQVTETLEEHEADPKTTRSKKWKEYH
jgi:hypothetical protein